MGAPGRRADGQALAPGKQTLVVTPYSINEVPAELPHKCQQLQGHEECSKRVQWAKDTGMREHPDWYPGLTECSTMAEFQDLFTRQGLYTCAPACTAGLLSSFMTRCELPGAGSACSVLVEWARSSGIQEQPHLFPGLSRSSSFQEFQDFFHNGGGGAAPPGLPAAPHQCGPACWTPWPDTNRALRATPDGVCMYELPTKFNLEHHRPRAGPPKLAHPHLRGILDPDEFGLERTFYDRMQKEATTLRMPWDCRVFYVPCFAVWEALSNSGAQPPKNTELLEHTVHYWHHRRRRCAAATPGPDHFVVLGRVSADANWFLDNKLFKNMIKLTGEHAVKGLSNVVGVPHPTLFRYNPTLETSEHVDSVELNCGGLQQLASASCTGKEACSFDFEKDVKRLCGDPAVLEGRYRCGGTSRAVRATLTGAAATSLLLSCRHGPCWLTGTCQEQRQAGPAPAKSPRAVLLIASSRPTEACVDGQKNCYDWASKGECTKNPDYMLKICKLSCHVCQAGSRELTRQCDARPQNCRFMSLDDLSRASADVSAKVGGIAEALLTSTFCMNVLGGTAAQRGFVDALVLGCIPVVATTHAIAHYQWHLPDASDACIVLPEKREPGFNMVDYLLDLQRQKPDVVQQKMTKVQQLAYSLQYSRWTTWNDHRGPDAFEVALRGVLERSRG